MYSGYTWHVPGCFTVANLIYRHYFRTVTASWRFVVNEIDRTYAKPLLNSSRHSVSSYQLRYSDSSLGNAIYGVEVNHPWAVSYAVTASEMEVCYFTCTHHL